MDFESALRALIGTVEANKQELTELKRMVSILGSHQEQIRSEIAELKHILIQQVMSYVVMLMVVMLIMMNMGMTMVMTMVVAMARVKVNLCAGWAGQPGHHSDRRHQEQGQGEGKVCKHSARACTLHSLPMKFLF